MPVISSTPDFRTNQIVTSMIITSGATGTPARLLIFDVSGSSNSSGSTGPAFLTNNIGNDVYIFVSGSSTAVRGFSPPANLSAGIALFGGSVVTSGSLHADVHAFVSQTLAVTGTAVFHAPVYLKTAASTLNVSGVATFENNLYQSQNNKIIGLSGTLDVGQDAYFRNPGAHVGASGTFAVAGNATFAGNVNIQSLASNTNISGSVKISGHLYCDSVSSQVGISGSTSLNTLSVSGSTSLSSDVFVNGTNFSLLVSSSTRLDNTVWFPSPQGLYISGTTRHSGDVYILPPATLYSSGVSNLRAGVNITSFGGLPALTVSGTSIFAGMSGSAKFADNIFFYVSGGIGSALTGTIEGLSSYGGDIAISGTVVITSGVVGAPTSLVGTHATGSWYFANVVNANVLSSDTNVFTANTVYLVPQAFENRTYIQQLAVAVTSGTGGSEIKLGMYRSTSANDIRPSTLLFEGSTLSGAAIGIVSSSANLLCMPGVYWFAINTASPGVGPRIRAPIAASVSPICGLKAADFTGITCFSSASSFATFPASFGTLTAETARVPGIAFKRYPNP